MVKKHGRTLVKEIMREVSYKEKVQHDVLGFSECYVEPHNGHMTYSPLSVYNPFHSSYMCWHLEKGEAHITLVHKHKDLYS